MNKKLDLFGLNASYVETLRAQWQQDPLSVPQEWRSFFETQGNEGQPAVIKPEQILPKPATKEAKRTQKESKTSGIKDVPMFGIAKKIVENMEASLELPTATSTRNIPVKVLEENRSIINDYLEDDARSRCSYTHLIAYAIIQAIKANPSMNNAFEKRGNKAIKLERENINLGLAIDLPAKDGSRTLIVPCIKDCQKMDFWTFFNAYNNLIKKARANKLEPADFVGTTVTLTNPGGIGTVASNPRLMPGQGAIFATGSIGYPAQYEASAPETLQALGVGKVMTVTSTYDHRVIQGAESGRFLASLHKLLIGSEGFFAEVFKSLRIPHHPHELRADEAIVLGQHAGATQTERAMRVSQLIHAYRVLGHLLAHVDPLHLIPRKHPELDLQNYGLTIWDLDRKFDTLGSLKEKTASFRTILRRLRNTYCRRMGVEYMYINDVEQKAWLQKRVEQTADQFEVSEKKNILSKLMQSEGFEHFLHKRYVGHKRFSIEGAEATIPMLNELLNCAASHNVTDVMLGMAHRGRLNVLANVVGKPYGAIFAEFEDIDPKTFQGTGDVKYHLGAKGIHRFKGLSKDTGQLEEREIRIQLACNPSHLEAVAPEVEGQVRAQQDMAGDRKRGKIIPVILHGDAAFASQGVVYEALQLSNLQGYRTGGTIHIVLNNQIGYTTGPEKARTSLNCTDVARTILAPVFRVNGDDPESCMRAIRIAFEYRQIFKRDVIIDLVCYRRHGHNEGDEPSFTQPILYKAIQKHPSVASIYGDLLVRRGDISEDELAKIKAKYHETFEEALKAVRSKGRDAFSDEHVLFGQHEEDEESENPKTGVEIDILKRITEKVTYDPKVIEIHPRILKFVLGRRHAMVFDGKPKIDFGMAEILAYGSLLLEGIPVRVSGQDCGRGTFAHRHAVLYDTNDGRPYIPLNHLKKTRDEGEEEWHPGRFRIYDSPLSEEAVLGFEHGYSVSHPKSLVIWEAQFGDFFNGAQVQIDQFISSAEAKWGQKSRLTMFLPHGYDGQGPEHSSGRMERFLQQCAQNNMRVANCSTAAQMFHLLRRQAKQPKKPLIVFTHKSILRLEDAASPLNDFADESFKTVIPDAKKIISKAKRVVFCTGKLYWELDKHRRDNEEAFKHVALVRIEQLYPLPSAKITEVLNLCAAKKEVVWVQEEPRNMGAFSFIAPRLQKLGVKDLRYIGRAASASPATGSPNAHKKQQKGIIEAVFAKTDDSKDDIEFGP
ncbi:multifunctional oxoglutarate decarboxylase/oxoglutarate dehydrogenase thiamine pyrophosphate-binding subunit/dihydrolipoyllysine-residue succinyltransferase subunit [Sulfobacillus acidophilus]|uniref:oxoglutarate dehydrogenase (succinyl-transferring) n=1 Tax=Sulfobacillus acidophilus TaxID=53633 RepID=A0ABS3AVC8_9FIRM|nr:multifunctional oxoglutarate decarboxylase/oxoglutarate dehydrogenase thiamine pyrophosphate-binding subunit/dihydrolipoyllysine-residue succinyltransferase subunit [Sulfobacillus acidophilus]